MSHSVNTTTQLCLILIYDNSGFTSNDINSSGTYIRLVKLTEH